MKKSKTILLLVVFFLLVTLSLSANELYETPHFYIYSDMNPKYVQFIKGNVENLPKEVINCKFDKIYCSEVLEHVENPVNVLKEIKKISKNNSIIVISVPNEKLINQIKGVLQKIKIFNFFFSNISKKMDDEWHLHSLDLKKLKSLIFNDYMIEKIKGIPYNFMPIRYVVKLKLKIND